MSPIRVVPAKVLIILAFLCLPLNGQAYPITIHFTGVFTGIDYSGDKSIWDMDGYFDEDATFAGYYSYDSNGAPFAEYLSTSGGRQSKYHTGGLEFSVGNIDGYASSAELTLSDDYNGLSDQYVVWADVDNGITATYPHTLRYFSLALYDSTNTALTDSVLPGVAPSLDSFSSLTLALCFGQDIWEYGEKDSYFLRINGTVTSVREVIPTPEPATMLLFAAGGLGIIGARYTRKK